MTDGGPRPDRHVLEGFAEHVDDRPLRIMVDSGRSARSKATVDRDRHVERRPRDVDDDDRRATTFGCVRSEQRSKSSEHAEVEPDSPCTSALPQDRLDGVDDLSGDSHKDVVRPLRGHPVHVRTKVIRDPSHDDLVRTQSDRAELEIDALLPLERRQGLRTGLKKDSARRLQHDIDIGASALTEDRDAGENFI